MWISELELTPDYQGSPRIELLQALMNSRFLNGSAAASSQLGRAQAEQIYQELPPIPLFSPVQQIRLLQSGYWYTGFLCAPLPKDLDCDALVLKAGAIMNLAVVLCDRLLESGLDFGTVIPFDNAGVFFKRTTAVSKLLAIYLSSFADPEHPFVQKILRTMAQAEFVAEQRCPIAYLPWLRKSALPWLAMALPAFLSCDSNPESAHIYLRWVYRLGRFLGAVDDAADYEKDEASGDVNCWRNIADRRQFANRLASAGSLCLHEWDASVGPSQLKAKWRTAFVGSVAAWLQA